MIQLAEAKAEHSDKEESLTGKIRGLENRLRNAEERARNAQVDSLSGATPPPPPGQAMKRTSHEAVLFFNVL